MIYRHRYFKDRYIYVYPDWLAGSHKNDTSVWFKDLHLGLNSSIKRTWLDEFYEPVKTTETIEPTKQVKHFCEICGLTARTTLEAEIFCDKCGYALSVKLKDLSDLGVAQSYVRVCVPLFRIFAHSHAYAYQCEVKLTWSTRAYQCKLSRENTEAK